MFESVSDAGGPALGDRPGQDEPPCTLAPAWVLRVAPMRTAISFKSKKKTGKKFSKTVVKRRAILSSVNYA
jgi:hypothetical protein